MLARQPTRLPVVLSKEEALRVITLISGEPQLVVKLPYVSGLRLMECLRLRVKDIDFEMSQIVVRHGKRGKDRVTVLPGNVHEALQAHLTRGRAVHENDLRRGYGQVNLPGALARESALFRSCSGTRTCRRQ